MVNCWRTQVNLKRVGAATFFSEPTYCAVHIFTEILHHIFNEAYLIIMCCEHFCKLYHWTTTNLEFGSLQCVYKPIGPIGGVELCPLDQVQIQVQYHWQCRCCHLLALDSSSETRKAKIKRLAGPYDSKIRGLAGPYGRKSGCST